MSNNRVKILAIGILSIALIAFAGYSVSGGNQAKASHFAASEVPTFKEELTTTNPTKSIAKRIIFKAHYLSKMMGTSSHSEFTKVSDSWYARLSKEANRLNESDRTVTTSILAMMRTYEDMKTFRSMGYHNAKNFWPVLSTMTNLVYDPKTKHLGSDGYGFTSCTVKKEGNQSNQNADQVKFWQESEKVLNGHLAFCKLSVMAYKP